jgi:hypothetical protein
LRRTTLECRTNPCCEGPGNSQQFGKRTERLPWQPRAEVDPRGCEDDQKKSADSRLAVVIKVRDSVSPEVRDSVSPEVNESVSPEVRDSVSPEVNESVSPEVREFHQKLKIMFLHRLEIVLLQRLVILFLQKLKRIIFPLKDILRCRK